MLLKRKIYQISLAVAIFAFGNLFFASAALAIPPENPNAGNLIVNFSPNPMFSDGNLLPGDTKIGEAKVINNTVETKRIAAEAINYPKNIFGYVPDNDLSRALTIIIRENGSDLYGGSSPTGAKTLFNFYKNGETYLSDVSGGGGTKTYQFEISFPADKEDEWQGTTTGFDIIVGFQGEEGGVKYCNNNGIRDNDEIGGVDCGGGGCPACNGGGGGGGGSLPPGLTIQYEDTVTVGANYAEIEWWTSYEATSQVVYSSKCEYEGTCTVGKKYKFDFNDNQWSSGLPPRYGYKNTTEEMNYPYPDGPNKVTYRKIRIDGLTSGTAYYFRCISHASPPTVSREHSFTTLALADGNGGKEENESGEAKGISEYLPPPSDGNAWETGGEISFRTSPVPKTGGGDSAGNNADSTNSGNVLGASSNPESAEKNGLNGGSASKPLLAGIEDQNTQNDSACANQDSFDNFIFILIILILIIIGLVLHIVKLKKNQKKNV